MANKKRKSRPKVKSTPIVKTVVEEIVIEKAGGVVTDNIEKTPFLIDGKKQYWNNKIYCFGREITGQVFDSDVKEFFKKVKDVDYSNWMSKTDKIQERLDLIRQKMLIKSGLK